MSEGMSIKVGLGLKIESTGDALIDSENCPGNTLYGIKKASISSTYHLSKQELKAK